MAGRIKGITIEIDGNTTKLQNAVKKSNAVISKMNAQLKDTTKLLKLNPNSTVLLRQKQEALTKSIDATRNKLRTEKEALDKLKQSPATEEVKEQMALLERQIIDDTQRLKLLETELRNFGSVGAQQIANVGRKIQALGGKISAVGKKLRVMSTIATVGLIASAKMASDFEDQMAKVATIADTSVVSLEDLSNGVLDISNATGKSSADLSEAMYQALSASIDTGDALEFVNQSAKLAKAGFLETSEAVDVLTTIINAYGYSAKDATEIGNMLVQTQNRGKTTVQQLAGSLGQVIPTASALNIDLANLNTAYVILTKQGINTANSTTYLNGMFNELSKSNTKVAKIIKERTGKTFGELMREGKSLGDVMAILNESVGGNSEQFLNLWSNTRAGKGALALVNGGVKEFNSQLGDMRNSAGNVDGALSALDTTGARARKALNTLKNTAIKFGQTLLEMLAPTIEKLRNGVEKLSKWFSRLSDGQKKLVARFVTLLAVASPILRIVGKLTTGVGTLMVKLPKLVGTIKALKTTNTGVVGGIKSLAKAVVSNPYLAIAVGAGVALTAVVAYLRKHNEIIRAYNKDRDAREKDIEKTIAQGATADAYMAKLDELMSKEEKSAEDKKLIQTYVDMLNDSVSGLNLSYDAETDKLNQTTQAIRNKISAYKDQMVQQAYANQMQSVANQYAQNEIELDKNRVKQKEILEKIRVATAEGRQEDIDQLGQDLAKLQNEERQLTEVNKGLYEELGTYGTKASGTLGTASSDFKKLEAVAKKAGVEIPKFIIDGIENGSIEVPKSLNDLIASVQTEADKIGVALADGIKNGMGDAKSGLLNFSSQYMTDLIASMKKSAKINSPSRVTRDIIGFNLGAGVAVGLEKSTRMAVASARGLVNSTIGAMSVASPMGVVPVSRGSESVTNNSSVVNNFTFNQPVSTPSETARAIRDAQIIHGLVGA